MTHIPIKKVENCGRLWSMIETLKLLATTQRGKGMNTLSLIHLVRQPKNEAGTPPLLLLLHGFGSNELDLYGLAPFLDERFLIISVRAPNTLGPESYAWFELDFTSQGPVINPEQAEISRKTLITFLNEAVTAYGADPKQVYLMGFSQGAIMSASVALTQPELVAGVAMMSGRILPEIQPLIASKEELAGLPFIVVHGTADTVLSITYGRASRDLLSSLPVELTYHEYQMGHEVSQESLSDVTTWLTEQLDKAI
jgi:phospholipase/carboxylesterase